MNKSNNKVITRHDDDDLDLDTLMSEEGVNNNSPIGNVKKKSQAVRKQKKVSTSKTIEIADLKDQGFKVKLISQPIKLIKFNFRNKRVTTQLIRFIPDELISEATLRYPDNINEQHDFIIDNVERIPRNSIIVELTDNKENSRRTSVQKANEAEKKQYPCHDDLYDSHSEGIFIGKGICFSNISTQNKELSSEIDSLIDAVNRNGKSVEKNGDVVEKPIIYANGSNFILKSGHLRICYLTFAFGRQFQYDFIQSDKVDENLHIYLENNAKHEETAYERLLSYYHTIKEQNLYTAEGQPDEEGIKKALAIGRSRYFQIINFVNNPKLIEVVKRNAVGQKLSTILSKLYAAKKLYDDKTKDYKLDTPFEVFWEEQFKVEPKRKVSTVNIKFPDSSEAIKKLLFSDVKSWSKLKFSDYDLNKKSDIHKLIKDLAEEVTKQNK